VENRKGRFVMINSHKDRRRHVRKFKLAKNAAAHGLKNISTASAYDAALVVAGNSADADECRTLLECVGLL
jgi:hypothetical protein